jgi:CheY-like chemotaxis protein
MNQSKARILIVAEKTEQMKLLTESLGSVNHMVNNVATNEAALSMLEDHTYHLVIIDIALPGLNGADLFRQIKTKYKNIPTVLITGSPDSDNLGMIEPEGIIAKPFRIGHVEQLINEILAQKNNIASDGMVGNILVVDDDDIFRTVLIRSLKLSGFTVFGAADGKMAIDLLKKGGIDTVIADVNMPLMDGVTLLKQIKKDWPQIPVVLVTGYFADGEGPLDSSAKADAFLMKPFKIQSITEILKNIGLKRPEYP